MIRMEKLIALILGLIEAVSITVASHAFEWGSKEAETEKFAAQFANQVMKGSYRIVTTDGLKAWIDKKEPMLLVDTVPV